MTDGTADYNKEKYRLSLFYDLAKTSVIRIAWAQAQELRPHQCTAVALTPGWLRSDQIVKFSGWFEFLIKRRSTKSIGRKKEAAQGGTPLQNYFCKAS